MTISPVYILGVLLFSRICFWALAHFKGLPFIESICTWDCHWYAQIVQNGYDLTPHGNTNGAAANWPFFPLYPFLIWIGHFLTALKINFISVLIANVSIFFAIILSLQYLKQTRTKVDAHFWVWLCCFGPYSFYFASGYSEALFWLLSCGAMLLWQNQKYLQAGIVGVLLSATRIFGLFWPTAWVVEIFMLGGIKGLFELRKEPQKLFAICLAPLGFFAFVAFLYFHMGDGLAFFNAQKAWGRTMLPFWFELRTTLSSWGDFSALFHENPVNRYSFAYFNYFALFGIGLFIWLAQQKRFFEAAIAFMLIATVIKSGLIGIPRYMFGVPIFAFAFHDLICHFISRKVRILFLLILALFNFWLLANWYDSAYFLV